ncbi:MAG: MFS transporter, partial [Cyanobacteria bacterium P01_F01_bin.53]
LGTLTFLIFSTATSNPLLTNFLSQLSHPKQQGKTLGFMESISGLGGCLGALGAGFLFSAVNTNWPYWVGAIMMGACTLFAIRTIPYNATSQARVSGLGNQI